MTIAVVVTRPLLYGGKRQDTGEVLRVSPPDAVALLDSGRADLCHASDRAAVEEARRLERDKMLSKLRR